MKNGMNRIIYIVIPSIRAPNEWRTCVCVSGVHAPCSQIARWNASICTPHVVLVCGVVVALESGGMSEASMPSSPPASHRPCARWENLDFSISDLAASTVATTCIERTPNEIRKCRSNVVFGAHFHWISNAIATRCNWVDCSCPFSRFLNFSMILLFFFSHKRMHRDQIPM